MSRGHVCGVPQYHSGYKTEGWGISREIRKGSMKGTQFKGRLYKEKEREGCLSGRLRKAKTFWVVHVKGRMGRRGRPHGALCPSPLSLEVPQPCAHSVLQLAQPPGLVLPGDSSRFFTMKIHQGLLLLPIKSIQAKSVQHFPCPVHGILSSWLRQLVCIGPGLLRHGQRRLSEVPTFLGSLPQLPSVWSTEPASNVNIAHSFPSLPLFLMTPEGRSIS